MQIQIKSNSKQKKAAQRVAFGVFGGMTILVVLVLFGILGYIFVKGAPAISWDFLSQNPEDGMTKGGIYPAIIGTFCLVIGSMIFAFPIGVMSGIYMNEYLGDSFLKRFIANMTNNLSGIPSIVFGLFGMALFVNQLKFGDSILAGSLTLGLLALPVIIRTTEEAMKAVPETFRTASLALGASKWQTVRRVVLPVAFPNIITGLILSVGRVSGETAPILFTVAAYFLPKLPHSIFDQVMALPYHLYVLSTNGKDLTASREMAFGTAFVLIMIVLISNLLATALRNYYKKKNKMG